MSVVSGILAANAQGDATKAQSEAADKATNTQLQMYNTQRQDFRPFSDPSSRAMATLMSSIYGGKVAYSDPSKRLSADETANINSTLGAADFLQQHGMLDAANKVRASIGNVTKSDQYFRDAAGNITNQAPTDYAEYKPQETEGFRYTKQRTLEDLGRQLRMMGRGSGTVASNATGRTLGDLNTANEQNSKNDLLNLVKIGQGAAGAASAAAGNAGNSLANLQLQQGNAAAQGHMGMANLYAGIPGAAAGGISSAFQMRKMLGGNGAAASENGTLYDSVGGDINKVDFGEF